MAWKDDKTLTCDNMCGREVSHIDRSSAVALARALGWSYGDGVTNSGERYEGAFCGGCRGVQMKRIGRRAQGYEDEPLW